MKHRERVRGIVRRYITVDPVLDTAVRELIGQHDGMCYSVAIGALASMGAGMPALLASHTQRWPSLCPTCGSAVGEHCVSAGTGKRIHDHVPRPRAKPRPGR